MRYRPRALFCLLLSIIISCSKSEQELEKKSIKDLFVLLEVATKKISYPLFTKVYSDTFTREQFNEQYADHYLKDVMIFSIVDKNQEIINNKAYYIKEVTFAADTMERSTNQQNGTIRASCTVFKPVETKSGQWKIINMIVIHNNL